MCGGGIPIYKRSTEQALFVTRAKCDIATRRFWCCIEVVTPISPPNILSQVETLARSLLLAALLSQGTPCVAASSIRKPGLLRFVAAVSQIRQRYQHIVAPPHFDSPRSLRWHGASADSEPDWGGAGAGAHGTNYLAYSVSGRASEAEGGEPQALYVGFNPHPDAVTAWLPQPPAGWRGSLLLLKPGWL